MTRCFTMRAGSCPATGDHTDEYSSLEPRKGQTLRTTAHPVLEATGTCDRRPRRIARVNGRPRRMEVAIRDGPTRCSDKAGTRDPSELSESRAHGRALLIQMRSDRFYANRPSDGRGPGIDPRPPCAFKVSMFNVFCNSH